MSGELGLAGYRFQYHVIVLTALELWCGSDDHGVESIVVEGQPGAEKVDFALVGRSATDNAVVQVKSRWGAKAWSARALFKLLMSLRQDAGGPDRLELVANGVFSSPARRLIELLGRASDLDDDELARTVKQLKLTQKPDAATLAALRRSLITVRPGGLCELRDQVGGHLRRLRAGFQQGMGLQATELLRAYLLELAMRKAEAADTAGRTLRREEFLAAVAASRTTMEQALASRWGVPVRLADRENAVRRDALLDQLRTFLTAEDGVHTVDGHVRSCVLAGPAGIGKTTLAQQYALDNAAEFDWIYQLTASGDDDMTSSQDVLGEEFEQFAAWLDDRGVAIRRGPHSSVAAAAGALAEALSRCSQSWLLIIDNATAADVLAPLLPASGHGAVLITTRNSAWHGSHPVVPIGALTADEARALVRRRLTELPVTDMEADALGSALDCIPLTLVTATSYLRSTRESIGAFLATVDDEVQRLDALNFPLQRLDDYPRTAVAAVNLSLRRLRARGDELSTAAMIVLRRASLVFPDRIPGSLLGPDRQGFNTSVAVLAELSLIDRWQDTEQRDWACVHRITQDVVRAELGTEPDALQGLVLDVELAATDMMSDCIRTADLVTGGALRLHAITLAERLTTLGLQGWQTTTALLANAGFIARLQGDRAEARRLVAQALDLIPPGDYDPHIAGRRGKTLATLAQLQLDHHETDAAYESLEQARSAHEIHRLIPAHQEALVECTALQCWVAACRATTDEDMRAEFDKVRSLPEPTFQAALARAACLVKIARGIDWQAGLRADFYECAERLLTLLGPRESDEPLAAATAHLCLAEAHGSEGAIDAAWRHYQRAHALLANISGIDPAVLVEESVDLVVGLTAVCVDTVTRFPYRDIDTLIRRLLADIDTRIDEIDWSASQQNWVLVKVHAMKATHAAHNGALDTCKLYTQKARRLARGLRGHLPANVATLADTVPALVAVAELQHGRKLGLKPGQDLAHSLAAPARPQYAPAPCRHFDPVPLLRPESADINNDDSPHRRPPQLAVDRARAIARHAALLQPLIDHGPPSADRIGEALQPLREHPQDMLDHLIGAWRMIDTLAYKISAGTGHTVEHIRDTVKDDLIRTHHDSNVDTVPTRGILTCLNNNWYPELNDILTQLDRDGMIRVIGDLIAVEYRLAADQATLTGELVPAEVENTRDIAVAFDSPVQHPGTSSYDPATGTVTVGRTYIGEPLTVRLHNPRDGKIDHVWLLGHDGTGRSNMLRLLLLEASISGVFCIFPSDPRNQHHYGHVWRYSVQNPAWIATNARDTLTSLEAATKIIDARTTNNFRPHPTQQQPGILFGIDDVDDILTLPRGRALVDGIVARGPAVGVGVIAVIRNLDCVRDNETLRRSIATSHSTMIAGQHEPDGWQHLRSTYGNHASRPTR